MNIIKKISLGKNVMWTLIYICWYSRSSLPSGDVNRAGKTICVKKPSAPQPFLCTVRSQKIEKLNHAQDLSTHKNIWTAQLDSLVHQLTGASTHWCINIGTMYASTNFLFAQISTFPFSTVISACIFDFPGSISNVSSQEHLAIVLGLITCWSCFIKTLSHTKLLAIL